MNLQEELAEMWAMPTGSTKEIACWNCCGSEVHTKGEDGVWSCNWCGHMKYFDKQGLVWSKRLTADDIWRRQQSTEGQA